MKFQEIIAAADSAIGTATGGFGAVKAGAHALAAIGELLSKPDPNMIAMREQFEELRLRFVIAQGANTDLLSLLNEIRRAVAEEGAKADLAQEYRPETTQCGVWVQRYCGDQLPQHDACTECLRNGIRSMLPTLGHTRFCQTCDTQFRYSWQQRPGIRI